MEEHWVIVSKNIEIKAERFLRTYGPHPQVQVFEEFVAREFDRVLLIFQAGCQEEARKAC